MKHQSSKNESEREFQTKRGKSILFWVVVFFLAINAAILYKVFLER